MKLPKLLVKKPKMSNFDIGYVTRMSAKPGVLYPVFIKDMLPGETINLNIQSLIKTYPTLAPLMGTFKVQFDIFRSPLRYYVPHMSGQDQDSMTVGKKLPQIYMPAMVPFEADPEETGEDSWFSAYGPENMIMPGTLWDYLLKGCYFSLPNATAASLGSQIFHFPAHYYKNYWDIFRSYYLNQQEPDHYYTIEKMQDCDLISSSSWTVNNRISDYFMEHHIRTISNINNDLGTVTGDRVQTAPAFIPSIFGSRTGVEGIGYPCCVLDMFGAKALIDEETIPTYLSEGDILLPGVSYLTGGCNWFYSSQYKYTFPRGLACRTYRNDYITSVLNSDKCAAAKQYVNVQNNKVSITEITFANKLQNYLELSSASDSRYAEWIRAQFGVTPHDDLMMPELLGSVSTWLNFEDVIQTSSDNSLTSQPLGSLAGKGSGLLGNNKTFDIYAEEHAICMVMMSIVPQVDYYQGFDKCILKETFDDLFKPALDNIGFQDLFRFELSALTPNSSWNLGAAAEWPAPSYKDLDYRPRFKPTYSGAQYAADRSTSVGKQPAWLEYKTSMNEVHGDFVDSLRYWTNARELFTPSKYARYYDEQQQIYRDFKVADPVSHFSTYIDPSQWNNAFADSSLDSENFLVQIKFDAYRKSPQSKNLLRKL